MRLNRAPAAADFTGSLSRNVYWNRLPPVDGNCSDSAITGRSEGQGGNVDPAALFPALQCGLDQLDALGPFGQRPPIGFVLHHMADEMLPLDLEAVVVVLRVRHFLPLVEKVH